MTYALGIELGGTVVRFCTAERGGAASIPAEVDPVFFVEGDHLVIGEEARHLATSQPRLLVTDVVAQFNAERLVSSGGRTFDSHSALGAFLATLLDAVTLREGSPASALTVSCPSDWNDDACGHLRRLIVSVTDVSVVRHLEVSVAALDAAERLPEVVTTLMRSSGELPPTQPTVRAVKAPDQLAPVVTPMRSGRSARRRSAVASACALGLLVIVVGVWTATRPGSDRSTPSTTLVIDDTTTTTIDTASSRVLTVGLLSAGRSIEPAQRAIEEINASGGVFGQDVFVVGRMIERDDSAAAVTQMASQGVAVIISDLPGEHLDAGLAVAISLRVPVCIVDGTRAPSLRAASVFTGGAAQCAVFLALAAESARSQSPARVAEMALDMSDGKGLVCTTYRQCREYVSGRQPIVYAPEKQSVHLLAMRTVQSDDRETKRY